MKRSETNDATVGQILRYMGWVQERLAGEGEVVEGLVIAHQADESLRFAIAAVPHVDLKLYRLDVRVILE